MATKRQTKTQLTTLEAETTPGSELSEADIKAELSKREAERVQTCLNAIEAALIENGMQLQIIPHAVVDSEGLIRVGANVRVIPTPTA